MEKPSRNTMVSGSVGVIHPGTTALDYDAQDLADVRSGNEGGCYDISSAGHLSAGDTYLEGALREIGEELGIHAEAEELKDLGLLEKVSHGVFYGKPFHDHEVSAVYLYTKPVEAEKLHLQESEVEAVRWMDLKECQKAVREGSIPNCIDIRELEMIEKAWFAGEKTKDEAEKEAAATAEK